MRATTVPSPLFLRRYDLASLSLYSYLVGDTTTGRAVVVDPQGDTSEYLTDHLEDLDAARPTVVYCAGGYRSSFAVSTLRAHGFDRVADLLGGYAARTAHQPTS